MKTNNKLKLDGINIYKTDNGNDYVGYIEFFDNSCRFIPSFIPSRGITIFTLDELKELIIIMEGELNFSI